MNDAFWAQLGRILCKMFCPCNHHGKRVTRIVTYSFKGVSFTAEGNHMALNLKDTDLPGTVDVTVAFVNAKGKPAQVDGVPIWSVTDATIIDSVTPSADGLTAKLHIMDTIGASQLNVNADVDLSGGVSNKDFVDTVSVIAGEAVAANFSFGAVTPD